LRENEVNLINELIQHYGHHAPSPQAKRDAADIIAKTPKGPSPYDVALSFITRFESENPKAISQSTSSDDEWNPLIVEFFTATNIHVTDDRTPWCAAFVNWCIERVFGSGSGTGDAGSQSFLSDSRFKRVSEPAVGDLAIFTCYEPGTDISVGLGHVGFVNALPADGGVVVLGGNQEDEGVHRICIKSFRIGDTAMTRKVGGENHPCTMRLNCYARIARK
jgi:uncharacterized protein (TIGR02594 family)